ncbi:cytochrome b [Methylophaga sulfidovorans]|uniref:Cytochrome b561 n=1 Tax=Methylophaga sulfidovorans TaxID=45496 RepID=A0A1I3VU52_9GAMM|nr:cytochrome b [Methylophaga sulfidovorans]SFJ98712.1 cytochrome b561 [Methylophaga sulfidovorans]
MKSKHTSRSGYDAFSIFLHWVIAVFIIALFVSGLWMVGLGYYDNWYYEAPWWHKGIGVATAILIVLRWCWSLFRQAPDTISSIPPWQHLAAKIAHQAMNIVALLIVISGYIMVTAKGDGLSVFDWFTIPALVTQKSDWVDPAGAFHLWAAYFLIGIAAVHALAAMKHHFIDKDLTLKQMLGTK